MSIEQQCGIRSRGLRRHYTGGRLGAQVLPPALGSARSEEHGAWSVEHRFSVDRHPVWLCYGPGTFTIFFTLGGVQLWTGLETVA